MCLVYKLIEANNNDPPILGIIQTLHMAHYSRSAGSKLNWVFKNYYNTTCDNDTYAVYM